MFFHEKSVFYWLIWENTERISFQNLFDWRDAKFLEINEPIQCINWNSNYFRWSHNFFVRLALCVRVFGDAAAVVNSHGIRRISSRSSRSGNWESRHFIPRMALSFLHLSGFNVFLRHRDSVVATGNGGLVKRLPNIFSFDPIVLSGHKNNSPVSVHVLV